MDEKHGDLHQWNGQMDASSAKDFPYSVEYGSSEPNWQLPILWKKEKLSMVPMEDLPTL